MILPQVLNVVPQNVESLTDHLSSTADIQDTVIHFGPGTYGELLMSIPLFWGVYPDSTIVIEIGIDNEYANSYDHDLRVGVSDGSNSNLFWIVDKNNYGTSPPCYPIVPERDQTLVSGDVPRRFKLIVRPDLQYGYCETAQEGGYTNVGVFENKVSSYPLFVHFLRHDAHEQYYIRYITIETANRYC